METIDKQFSNSELTISSQNKEHLQEAAKWAYFLAIVGFGGFGQMVLGENVVMFGLPFNAISIVWLAGFLGLYGMNLKHMN